MSEEDSLSAYPDDIGLLIEENLPKVIKAFHEPHISGDPRALRVAYIEYLSALLNILDESGCHPSLSIPIVALIKNLEDLGTGTTAPYLRAEKVGQKPPKSNVEKFRELFIAVSLNVLMEELAQKEAVALIGKWCSRECIDIGGRDGTSSGSRIKRIRDEISENPQQKSRYLRLCSQWATMGKTRTEAALALLRIAKQFPF